MAVQKEDIIVLEDRELFQKIAEGDEQAFGYIRSKYLSRVYGNTLTLVKSPQRAEEITQDIFLKIWLMRDRLVEVLNFMSYVYVLGRNQITSELRKKVTLPTVKLGDILETNLRPDRRMESKELNALLLKGISKLSPQQEKLFKMSKVEGLTHEEIGKRLGIPKNTVKGHMVLALNFLRNYIRDHEFLLFPFLLLTQLMLK